MMENLVPLEGSQAAQTSFPFGSLVYVCGGGGGRALIETHGIVTGVYIKMVPILDMLFKVKTPASEEIYKTERLRFRHGCPVYVKRAQNSSAEEKGVVLGICDVPRSSLHTVDTYWYSVEVESKEMASVVLHEVRPCDVTFRPREEQKSEEGKSKDFPIAISIKEEPNEVISCIRANYTEPLAEMQPEIQLNSKIASAWCRSYGSEINQKMLNASKTQSTKRRPVDKPSLPASDSGTAKRKEEQISSVTKKRDRSEPTVPEEAGSNPGQSTSEVVGMPPMLCLPLSASRDKKKLGHEASGSSKTKKDKVKSTNREVHLDYKRQRHSDIPPRPHESWTKVINGGTRIFWCEQCTRWASQYHTHNDIYPTHYCWTHGVTRNANHTSGNCNKRANGHKVKATFHRRLGGSNKK